VTGAERRIEPLGEEDPRPRQTGDGARRLVELPLHVADDRLARLIRSDPPGERANRLHHSLQRPRIERQDVRGDGAGTCKLGARDGTDRAEILRDDQIGGELLDQARVDDVQRVSVPHRSAHRRVDLQARQLGGLDLRRGHDRLADHLQRPSALVRDRDERIDHAELRDHLRRTRKQRADAHPLRC